MASSKNRKNQDRMWIKWFQSGAVKQPLFPAGSLIIEGIGIKHYGPGAGYSTLSLGSKVVYSGPGGTCTKPICAVVVPTNHSRFQPGKVLDKLPGNAVPCDLFYRNK